MVNRLIWVEVLYSDGRIGWIPATYLTIITPTSTKTPTVTLTSTGKPTNTTFVSPDNGSTLVGNQVRRIGLTEGAGSTINLHFTANVNQPFVGTKLVKSIYNDFISEGV